MDTTDMPDDTILPGHRRSLGEMRETIRKMRELSNQFYWLCFKAGMGSECHAFIEFNGLHGKFIDMCAEALKRGVEFPDANTHSRTRWPLDGHHVDYLGEKFNCIYGFAINEDPELRELFIKSGLGPKKEKR